MFVSLAVKPMAAKPRLWSIELAVASSYAAPKVGMERTPSYWVLDVEMLLVPATSPSWLMKNARLPVLETWTGQA